MYPSPGPLREPQLPGVLASTSLGRHHRDDDAYLVAVADVVVDEGGLEIGAPRTAIVEALDRLGLVVANLTARGGDAA